MRIPWVTATDTPRRLPARRGSGNSKRDGEEVHHRERICAVARGVPPVAPRGAAAGDPRSHGGGGARRSERELRVQAGEEEAARDRRAAAQAAEAARVVRGGRSGGAAEDGSRVFRRDGDARG